MREFEVSGAGAGVVGTEAFDGLRFFVGSEEAGGGDVVVEKPVDYGSGKDGDETDEHEDARRG